MAGGNLQALLGGGGGPRMMGGNFGMPTQQAPMAPPMVSDPVSMGHPMANAYGGPGTYGSPQSQAPSMLRGDFTGMGMGGFGGQNQFGGAARFSGYGGFPAAGMTSTGQAMRPAMFEWPYAGGGGGMGGLAQELTSLQTGSGAVPVGGGVTGEAGGGAAPPTPWQPSGNFTTQTGGGAAAASAAAAPLDYSAGTLETGMPVRGTNPESGLPWWWDIENSDEYQRYRGGDPEYGD